MDEYAAHMAMMQRKAADTLKGCYWQAFGGLVVAVLGGVLQVPGIVVLGVVVAVVGFVRAGRQRRRIDELTAQALQHKAVG